MENGHFCLGREYFCLIWEFLEKETGMEAANKNMYEDFLVQNGFCPDETCTQFCPAGTCYTIPPERGKGYYWFYTYMNLFTVSICDLVFYEDFLIEYRQPEYLTVAFYDSVSGEELSPYKRLSCSCIRGHFGHNNIYRALMHKNIPIRFTDITVMPEYYRDYLKTKYPGEYENPQDAFLSVDGSTDFPELMLLLKQIKNHRSSGLSAKLFYESKVAEAVSLIIQKTRKTKSLYTRKLPGQDLLGLKSVASYIDDHFAAHLSIDTLSRIACMSATKLKYTFKEAYKSTISEYILNKRLAQAEYLLVHTDLSISQIAQAVGYKKSGNFSDAFHKNTGLLPLAYRKASGEN
jgi:AraC-like DNA-binding protein